MLSRHTINTAKLSLQFFFSSSFFPSRKVFPRGPLVSSTATAYLSTDIVGENPILVRDFIHSALYDPNKGYFSQRSGAVGILERSIKFNQFQGTYHPTQLRSSVDPNIECCCQIAKACLEGHARYHIDAVPCDNISKPSLKEWTCSLKSRKAYMHYLDKIYRQNDISWFTPVELFKPWYAHGIAEAIMRTANLSVPLKIYEIGGGSGSCAKCIMDYIMLNAPERVYKNMTYISVEISPSLAKKQLETVGEVRSHLSRFRVECRDAANRGGWGNVDPQPCWVIMLEVLDNLPHDLIYSENQVSPWKEVWLQKQEDSQSISELYKPLQDPLITRCLEIIDLDKDKPSMGTGAITAAKSIWAKLSPKPRRSWIPTGCLKLLEVLHGSLPKMSLIASDFSYLPDVKIPGVRAPLVSTKKDGSSSDHNSYLDAKGDADIFFPTDFWLLEQLDHSCSGWVNQPKDESSKKGKKRRAITLGTDQFMEEFGLPSKTRTKDGYNPLLDDFKNTKFYLSVPTHNTV